MDGSLNWQRHSITSLAHRYLSKVWKKELKHVELPYSVEKNLRKKIISELQRKTMWFKSTNIFTYCTFNSTGYFDSSMSTCTIKNTTIPLQAFFDLPHHSESYHYTGSAAHSSATENINFSSVSKSEGKKLIADTSTKQVSDDSQKINYILFLLTKWESNHFNKSGEFWYRVLSVKLQFIVGQSISLSVIQSLANRNQYHLSDYKLCLLNVCKLTWGQHQLFCGKN